MPESLNLNDIAVFVKVAQFENFTKAAHSLGMPVSTVSRCVSNLEEQLGVTLMTRTTRKLTLTAQGRAYFSQCLDPLAELYDAERALTKTQKEPEGLLKVSVPVLMGDPAFLEFISGFMKKYPRLQIDLFITNQFLDLVAENIDISIRFGDLKDSSLIARRLGANERYLVASPAYMKGKKKLYSPEDISSHECLVLNGKNNKSEWDLINGKKKARVVVSGPISSRDFQSVSYFVDKGHGIGLLPASYCEEKIKSGQMIRLLPEWTSPRYDVHAIYPTRKFVPSKLNVFLEALKNWESPFWS